MDSSTAQLVEYTQKVRCCLTIYAEQGTSAQLTTEITNARLLDSNSSWHNISFVDREAAIKACIDVCALPRIARDIGPVAGVIFATLLQLHSNTDPLALLWKYCLKSELICSTPMDTYLPVVEFINLHALYLPLCRGLLVANPYNVLQSPLSNTNIYINCSDVNVHPTTLMELLFYLAVGMSNQPEIQHRFMAFDTLTQWFSKLNGPLDAYKRQLLIALIWDSWRDPVDAVRHKVKMALEGLLKNLAVFPMDEIVTQEIEHFKKDLVLRLIAVDWREEMKYGFLECLVPYVSTNLFMSEELQSSLMLALSDVVVGSYAMSLFVAIMEHLTMNDLSNSNWNTVWIPLMARGLLSNEAMTRKHMGRVVAKLFKFNTAVFQPLYTLVTSNDVTITSDRRTAAWLTVLRTAKSQGIITTNTELQDLARDGQHALSHSEEQVRLDLLSLVCEARRTTDPVTAPELLLVKQFLRINMGVTGAHFRQDMSASMTRLMKRLHDNAVSCAHGRSNYPPTAYEPGHQFVGWLVRHCIRGLLPSLHGIASTVTYHCHNCSAMGDIIKQALFIPIATQSLLALLLGSYDANRLIAIKCLAYFPAPLPGYDTPDKVTNELLVWGWSSLADPKASQSDGGASIVLLLFQKYISALGWYLTPPSIEISTPKADDPKVYFMTVILSDIEDKIALAKTDLSMASRRYPLHGSLKTLSYLYQDIMTQYLLVSKETPTNIWSSINMRLCRLIDQVIEVVVEALEHPAPEGYEQQEEEELLVLRSHDHHYLLSYCWRGIKEASALLEDVVRGGNPFLSADLIIECGERLKQLLIGLRHRGAFSHVYPHFEAVCFLLHRSTHPTLSAVSQEWLKSMMDQMASRSISITRRSGGIPYGVLALVLGDPLGQLLHTAVSQLFTMTTTVASTDQHNDYIKENEEDITPQVHAMNTLRILLTDARLGKHITRYIGHSFKLAINGMASSSWSIRNCSVMMLSALVTRIFGIKSSTANERDVFNGPSVREFFKKYPELEPFLLSKLSLNFTNLITEEHVETSLYPVLLVLARLKPSLTDQDVQVDDQQGGLLPFITAIKACGDSRIYKIREMAAHALVSLVNTDQVIPVCQQLVKDIQTAGQYTTNELHGRLCQLYQLLRHYPRHQPAVSTETTSHLMHIFNSLITMGEHPCGLLSLMTLRIIKETLFSVNWWQSIGWTEDQVTLGWQPWLEQAWKAIKVPLIPTLPGATLCRPIQAALLAHNAVHTPSVWLPSGVESGLDLLRYHLLLESHYAVYDAILQEIHPFAAKLPSEVSTWLLEDIMVKNDMDASSLIEIVHIMHTMNCITEKQAMDAWPVLLTRFQIEKRLGRRANGLPLLGFLLSRITTLPKESVQAWMQMLTSAVNDEAPLEMRRAAIIALRILVPTHWLNIQLGWILWQSMQDDDEDIRKDATTIATSIQCHTVYVISPLFSLLLGEQVVSQVPTVQAISLDNSDSNSNEAPLFEQEPLNAFREKLFNIQLATKALLHWYQQEKTTSELIKNKSSVFYQLSSRVKRQINRIGLFKMTTAVPTATTVPLNSLHEPSQFLDIYRILMGAYLLANTIQLGQDNQRVLMSFMSLYHDSLPSILMIVGNTVITSISTETIKEHSNNNEELNFMLI
ncbi:putative death-receptor fusion protein-domain-containing protein [Syncephalis fuscata]|nr:putative death-receptor fusion protein-domain-containing protein [Syncephalis fuscata]